MRIIFASDSVMEKADKYSKKLIVSKMELRKILWDEESVKGLAKTFGCTERTVRNALSGVNASNLCLRIRKRAIDIGLREKGEEKVTVLN